MKPFISACCKTYGRVATLEETLFSFLNQQYDGKKQLVIYNDFDLQTLEFNHPEVKIINTKNRSPNLGVGRNLCINAADGDVIIAMDDDDIYLPRHLEVMSNILGDNDYARFCGYYCANTWKIDDRVNGNGNFIVHTKDAWRKVNGYSGMNAGEDIDFTQKLIAAGLKGKLATIPERDTTFIYCWSNGVYHVSGQGPDVEGKASAHERVGKYARAQVMKSEIPHGLIKLKPRWKTDWETQAKQFRKR